MTIKCLTPAQQGAVLELYRLQTPPAVLAVMFTRSERTIGRILEAHGEAPVARRKPLPRSTQPMAQLSLFPQPTPYQAFRAAMAVLRPARRVQHA
jgi:hypothetical protein